LKTGKKILLVNPWIYDFAAFDMWMKPMGLLYISSFLKSTGYDVSLIDCLDRGDHDLLSLQGRESRNDKYFGCGNFHREIAEKPQCLADMPRNYCRYGMPPEIFKKKLSSMQKPDFVLVTSVMTYWYPGVQYAIKMIRESFPDTKILLGGIYATLCPEHAAANSGADVIYKGRGLKKLISILSGDLTPDKIESDEWLFAGELPYPDFSDYQNCDYFCIMTSQGCPFNCAYCASGILDGKYIQRDYKDVLKEIELQIESTGATNIAFYDDALLVNAEGHFEKILDGIIERRMRVSLHAPNGLHPRFITEDIAEKMNKAQFKTLRLSLETSDPDRQESTGGKVKSAEYAAAVNSLKDAGFTKDNIGTYVFFGIPGQPLSEVEESISFVKAAGSSVNLVEYSPIPGTVMWNELVKNGVIVQDMDPVLQNNSVFFRKFSGITENELQRLKGISKE